MKKLMIAASVAMCGVMLHAEGISSDVVGYATSALKQGSTGVGAQFLPIGGEKMDLCDIIPVGYDKETYKGGSIDIQMLDAKGRAVSGSNFYWYDDEDGTGWFDGKDDPVVRGQVTYAPGDAIWVKANSEKEGLQSAGQVASGSINVYLREGCKLVCNPTPVAIPFNNDKGDGKFIAPGGYGKDYKGGSIDVQKLDAKGRAVSGSNFYWYDDQDGTAWFDGSDKLVVGATLNPGEAIWVRANNTEEFINFPAALK